MKENEELIVVEHIAAVQRELKEIEKLLVSISNIELAQDIQGYNYDDAESLNRLRLETGLFLCDIQKNLIESLKKLKSIC